MIIPNDTASHRNCKLKTRLEELNGHIATARLPELNPRETILAYLKPREIANRRLDTIAEVGQFVSIGSGPCGGALLAALHLDGTANRHIEAMKCPYQRSTLPHM